MASSSGPGPGPAVVQGKHYPTDLVAEKCASDHRKISKKKNIDLTATGDINTNRMLNFLQCQVKATKRCTEVHKDYMHCHKSYMGVGSYKGRKNCGKEMTALFDCSVGEYL